MLWIDCVICTAQISQGAEACECSGLYPRDRVSVKRPEARALVSRLLIELIGETQDLHSQRLQRGEWSEGF